MTHRTAALTLMLVVGILCSPAAHAEWARYRSSDRCLRDLSVPPFTIAPGPGDVDVLLPSGTTWPAPPKRTKVKSDFSGLEAVDCSDAPAAGEQADALRQSLGSIFAGDAVAKRQRWVTVLEKYPAASSVLTLLRGALTPDAKATVVEIAKRICAKVGDPLNEVLTAAEYDALVTLATGKGLGTLFPARPGC